MKESPYDDVTGLETSVRLTVTLDLIGDTLVDVFLRPVQERAFLLDTIRKSEEVSQGIRKTMVELHKSTQIPDDWRCCIHLFKQLDTSLDMMGTFNHPGSQE